MRFLPHPMLRVLRWFFIFVLVGLPFYLSTVISEYVIGESRAIELLCIALSIAGGMIIHFGFWEKLFSVLLIVDSEIRWQCPFRRTRILTLQQCVEIGVYVENKDNGVPSEQIYFSAIANPPKNISKCGVMKSSQNLIFFPYSEELFIYITETFLPNQIEPLIAYRQSRK